MARHPFGDTVADWAFTTVDSVDGNDDMAQVAPGVTITAWNDPTGGTQIVDLQDETGAAVDHVTTSDGGDGRAPGTIPTFYADEDRWALWASADGGPRVLMVTADVGSVLGPLVDQINLTLTEHTAAANPHGTASVDLTDFSPTQPTPGQVPQFDGEEYVPTTVEGLDPDQFVGTGGGSTIAMPEGNVDTAALVVRLPAERTGAVNAIRIYWNAGSAGTPSYVETFRVAPTGELILQPSAIGKVPLEVRQFSGSQSANLTNWATSAGVPISYVDASGRVRAPNLGISPSWSVDAPVASTTGEYRYYNLTGVTLQLRGFLVSVGGLVPTGSAFVINPKLDGVALYSVANRPTVPASGRSSGLAASLASSAWPALSYLTVDIVSVGTTQAATKVHIQALAY